MTQLCREIKLESILVDDQHRLLLQGDAISLVEVLGHAYFFVVMCELLVLRADIVSEAIDLVCLAVVICKDGDAS